jgi:cytoskeletal protein RodZ
MKRQWMAYVIVALLAIGAGVAIAGLPNNVPASATITSPTSTETSESTTAPTSVAPDTTETTTETTTPVTTTADTTAPAPTEPDVTEPTDPDALPDRSEIVVAVANGAGIGGTAARNVERLAALGYENLTQLDGTEIVEFTVIYFADGFDAAAARMAEEFELLPVFVAPLADAPAVVDLPDDTELLAYIGTDRAN